MTFIEAIKASDLQAATKEPGPHVKTVFIRVLHGEEIIPFRGEYKGIGSYGLGIWEHHKVPLDHVSGNDWRPFNRSEYEKFRLTSTPSH